MAKFVGFSDGPPEPAFSFDPPPASGPDPRTQPSHGPPHRPAPGQWEAQPQGRLAAPRWGKWLLIGASVLVALFVVYAVASPFITVYRMKAAAERRDGKALSSLIDFPSVRQSLKDQFDKFLAAEAAKQSTQDNPFGAMGTMLAGALADKLVDTLVTPEGVERLMSGERLTAGKPGLNKDTADPFSGASMSYESFDRFVVSFKDDEGKDVKFVYRPRGVVWKLSGIEMEP